MKKMPAGEFKARCLRVMEDVKAYRRDVFGCMAGTADIVGDIQAPVLPARAWKAVR
ncbi:MAG: hypothetical protein ACREJG_04760 [Candidatus Rokuibacteriota bacterium]